MNPWLQRNGGLFQPVETPIACADPLRRQHCRLTRSQRPRRRIIVFGHHDRAPPTASDNLRSSSSPACASDVLTASLIPHRQTGQECPYLRLLSHCFPRVQHKPAPDASLNIVDLISAQFGAENTKVSRQGLWMERPCLAKKRRKFRPQFKAYCAWYAFLSSLSKIPDQVTVKNRICNTTDNPTRASKEPIQILFAGPSVSSVPYGAPVLSVVALDILTPRGIRLGFSREPDRP